MKLHSLLERAKSEEDIKDAYIKALGLNNYRKGTVDLETDDVWFEAKESATSPVLMFSQLLCYVRNAYVKGIRLPPILAVIDREKAALMNTSEVLELIQDNNFFWPSSPSNSLDIVEQVRDRIHNKFVVYHIGNLEKEFISAFHYAIRNKKILRISITKANLRQVFDKWVDMVGKELYCDKKLKIEETDYAVLFFADIMHDGRQAVMSNLSVRLLYDGDKPVYIFDGLQYELASHQGYRRFWSIYFRPPENHYRQYLLERRDSLLPIDERRFKGAFYTPLHIVDKAYDLLAETLGDNWHEDYIVWDMCCGVGNLEIKHSNLRNVYMSTLDQADLDVMRAGRICVAAAAKFQYDYLNDDIVTEMAGYIDYNQTKKIPNDLSQAIADARSGKPNAKKILILMNPPYGEAGNTLGKAGKTNIANTMVGSGMKKAGYGKASNELFAQFLARIAKEIPNATIAMFSTLKYVNAPNFDLFRKSWHAKYLGGFAVHSKAFDGLKGDFPIGFLIWDTRVKEPIKEISTTTLDKFGNEIGQKFFYNIDQTSLLKEWIPRGKKNDKDVVPLSNAVTPVKKTEKLQNTKWSNNAIGHFFCDSNDFQHAGTETAIFSSVHSIGHAGGYFITAENLWQVAIVFSIRMLISHTWQNHNDQFLIPSKKLSENFKSDCLVYMLFAGKNLTASADGLEWNGKTWSLVNHFIPFTEDEVGANGRFESDFMVKYMKGLNLSQEALSVLAEGKKLWQKYHTQQFERKIRDEFKLNRPDVGWYQIRKALESNNNNVFVDFQPFKIAYNALTKKLQPMVYEYGFLK